eukprot:c3563_g1_i1.p1 GENE.c3563_g1_i1~~c3563_g1_i1.p1  ORF type:complete len:730 (-),score=186.76 c3563_g1_i1:6-2195(-)
MDETREPLLNNNPSQVTPDNYDLLDVTRRKNNAMIGILAVLFVGSVAVIVVLASKESMTPNTEQKRAIQDSLSFSIRTSMGDGVDPCQDFYQYACGGWLQSTTIPPDKNTWSRSFSVIHERSLTQLREILDEGDKTIESKFYQSCMDEEKVNKRGITPVQSILDLIDTQLNETGPLVFSATLDRLGVSSLLGSGVEADVKNPKEHILTISQGGIGLPDRQYYFDEAQAQIREEYVNHISKMLQLSGVAAEVAPAQAKSVLEFETELANVSLKREDMRDPEKLYNKHTLDWLMLDTPNLPWVKYFVELFGTDADVTVDVDLDLNVAVPTFFTGLNQILSNTSIDTLKPYFRFRVMHSYSSALSDQVRAATFEFYGQKLSGQEQQPPRWKKCVSMTDGNLGDAIGRTYSELHFTSSDKMAAQDLINRVEQAFQDNLVNLRWMDNKTREATVEKLKLIANNVGYPDHWIDYSALETLGSDLFENEKALRKFEFVRELKKLNKPVDRDEWDMSAPTVNAYYDPSKNKMVFPAGILQLPFFDRTAPAAVNFGAIGAVMGHELTHAFDDEGRKFDGEGKLRDWWEPEAIGKFEQEAKCVENQFNDFVVPGSTDNTHISGKLTLGENLADLGGVKAAYNAFQKYKASRRPTQLSNDHPNSLKFLSEDQLFFVSYAQSWCEHVRDQYAQMLSKTDPHSPPRYRVQGPLSNSPEFAEAFHCAVNSTMRRQPEEMCRVW